MAFERLPQLRRPEETKVSARVIDVFYRPQTKPVDQTLSLLSESLERFNPNLQKYIQKKEEVTEKVDTAKAQADYNKNRTDFKNLIEKGEIPEGASPYYVNAYINAELREKARQFNDELFAEYQNSNVRNSLDPNAFGKFYTQYAQQWANTNGLNLYDNVALAEGFIPFADASRSNLESQHVQGRVTLIEDNNKKLLDKEVINILNDSLEFDDEQIDAVLENYNVADIDEEDKRLLYASLEIKTKVDLLIKNGMKSKTANKVVIDAIVTEAIENEDDTLLEVINNIVTDEASNSFLGGTTYAKNQIEAAESKILDKQIKKERYIAWFEDREESKAFTKDTDAFLQYILSGKGTDVEKFIQTYAREDGSKITSLDTIRTLNSFGTAWLNAQDVIDENDDIITSITKDIYNQPLKGNIMQRITSALMNKDISSKTAQDLIKTFSTATANIESGYLSSKGFTRIEKGLEQFITKGELLPDGDVVDRVDVTLIELYRYANNLIRELETSDKFSEKTDFEREEIFFEKMIAYSRLLKSEIDEQTSEENILTNEEFTEGVQRVPKDTIKNPYD